MKGKPVIKPTANLKLNSDGPLQALENTEEVSELQKLLMDKENIPAYKVQESSFPAVSNTNYAARELLPVFESAMAASSSKSSLTQTASDNQYISGWTSESGSSENVTVKYLQLRQLFLDLIEKNPKRYLGLPQQFWWALKHICDENSDQISQLTLIVTLFKIKQNDSMIRIGDQFQIHPSSLTNMFERGVKCMSNFFQNLVYLPSPKEIKANLPTVFKTRYSNVQFILDCFEIEIEKPTDPLRQAQTWSQYKNCNTLKYLIGCTPNGFVAFISGGLGGRNRWGKRVLEWRPRLGKRGVGRLWQGGGSRLDAGGPRSSSMACQGRDLRPAVDCDRLMMIGGRISDKAILERSNLINVLPFNAVVMADRGFKEVETHLMTKGVKLLRPPSVYSGTKPTKEQVVLTKVIASLRVHVERVIRRLREFRMLKLHSMVHHTHVGYMDQIVTIACGLINLQETIIKDI